MIKTKAKTHRKSLKRTTIDSPREKRADAVKSQTFGKRHFENLSKLKNDEQDPRKTTCKKYLKSTIIDSPRKTWEGAQSPRHLENHAGRPWERKMMNKTKEKKVHLQKVRKVHDDGMPQESLVWKPAWESPVSHLRAQRVEGAHRQRQGETKSRTNALPPVPTVLRTLVYHENGRQHAIVRIHVMLMSPRVSKSFATGLGE